jgi:hypothetical protein
VYVVEPSVRDDRRRAHRRVETTEPLDCLREEGLDLRTVTGVCGYDDVLRPTRLLSRPTSSRTSREREASTSRAPCVASLRGRAADARGSADHQDTALAQGLSTTLMQPSCFFWKMS